MTPRPGVRNLITDVAGLLVGNAEDRDVGTGVTVILCPPDGAVAAADMRGGAPGTRETDALDPVNLVDAVHAVVLSGGSAFGLDAAGPVQRWLADRGRGFDAGVARIPIVPAAILFDLAGPGDKTMRTPDLYSRLGRQACDAAGPDFALGNAGAGLGAVAGTVKGGLGSASAFCEETRVTVGALAAVNAFGSPVTPDGRALWAAPFALDGEFGDAPVPPRAAGAGYTTKRSRTPGGNTTIAVVATDAALSPVQARRMAIMAQDGLARALRPAHTPFDGDTVFALATGTGERRDCDAALVSHVGTLAADCLTRAIGRAVVEARSLGGFPAWRDLQTP